MALIDNKKAYFNYEILEKFEAGLELFGHEVKSLRAGHGSLAGSYITIGKDGAFLVGALVSPYQVGNTPEDYDPRRSRRLLLNKKEIERLINETTKTGLTIVPLALYNKNRRLKLELAIVRGKKKHDKRQTINKRESDRQIGRILKGER